MNVTHCVLLVYNDNRSVQTLCTWRALVIRALCKVFAQTHCHYKPTIHKGEIHFISNATTSFQTPAQAESEMKWNSNNRLALQNGWMWPVHDDYWWVNIFIDLQLLPAKKNKMAATTRLDFALLYFFRKTRNLAYIRNKSCISANKHVFTL